MATVNWKILAKFVKIPPEAWDCDHPARPGQRPRRHTARRDAVALNPQPLPPHEAVVGRPAARERARLGDHHRRRQGGRRGRRRAAGRDRRLVRHRLARQVAPAQAAAAAGTTAWSSPERRSPPPAWPSSTTTPPRCRRRSAPPPSSSPRPPAGADPAGSHRGGKRPRQASAPGPTIGRWSRAPSLRCCTSTATSCAPPPPTGRRRHTATRSGALGPQAPRPAAGRAAAPAPRGHPAAAATTCTPWPGSSCWPSGAAPGILLDGLPADLRDDLAAGRGGQPDRRRCCGPASTSGTVASRRRALEPPPEPDHHQRWFEQRATPGDAGDLSVFLHPYRRPPGGPRR